LWEGNAEIKKRDLLSQREFTNNQLLANLIKKEESNEKSDILTPCLTPI